MEPVITVVSVLLGVSAIAGIGILRQRAQAGRLATAGAEHPGALVIPIVIADATGAASRWIAKRTGNASAELDPAGYAAVAVDEVGVHLVGRLGRGFVAAEDIVAVTVGSTRHGWGEPRPAVVIRVRLGDEEAPLPLLPAEARRRRGAARDAHVAELVLDIRAALRGDAPVGP